MRDVYVLSGRWERARDDELFMLANRLQVPSYISLTTALAFYEATTQVQQDFVESIAVKRTKKVVTVARQFEYTKVAKELYFGFVKRNNYFIARPEKALLDALYIMTLGRYRLDVSSVDKAKFDVKLLKDFSKRFPEPTRRILKTLWQI
ncbi:MAG: hypothetical protein HYY14_03105 [Candidatus Omnitrophica bacterium]|nr:hypothetical protein [Candidatus Omnitrophota bacterium]